jgi:hypothetical protein
MRATTPTVFVSVLVSVLGCAQPAMTGSPGSGGSGLSTGSGGVGPTAGGAGTGGGVVGGAGAGGTTTISVGDCPGLALRATGVLDLPLRSVTVTGAVTLNGAPLPTESGARGTLTFTADEGRTTASVSLGTSGAFSYGLRVPPGTYDVAYVPNPALCTATSVPTVPCGGGVLRHGVALTSSGALDLDISVVDVTGAVTLQHATLPAETVDRGALQLRGPSGAAPAIVPLGSSGAAGYHTRLIPGTYDVAFQGNAAACTQATAPAVPCNAGTLMTGIPLTSSGALDVDIPAVHVTGGVTVNGAAMPAETVDRGALTFALAGAAPVATRAFGTSGAASYAMTLLPGTYAIAYAPNPALCELATPSTVPCVGGRVSTGSGAPLATDGVFDVDLAAATVTGAVTLRGAPLPAPGADRGRLSFSNDAGGSGTTRSLGTSGAGTYQIRVLAARYDVAYVANAALCAKAVTGAVLPCNGGRVSSGVPLTAGGALDVDIPAATVSGNVTLNGAALPAATAARGALVFTAADGSSVSTPSFGTSGAASFGVALFPGTYAVALAANAQLCSAGGAAPAVPCVGGAVVRAAPLTADGALDVDIPAVSLSGAVTLDGAPLPSASTDRGSVTLARLPAEGGGGGSVPLGTSATSYALTAVAGTYVVDHGANPALCNGTTVPGVPCASQVLFGCGH